ncbi:MAG: L,D-transpeptidase family protein [Clostridia bacterium]|nr:L,D-transpeptidase family protein [Clostridia bacterium]
MSRSWKKAAFLLLAAALGALLLTASAGAEDVFYGYTKNQAAVYSAMSADAKTKTTIPAFTVVRMNQKGAKYLRLEDGTYLLAQDVGIFTVNSAGGKIVYWLKDQTMYATGNPNHPLQTKVPANTAISPLHIMVDYYLVEWDGVYGFVPRKEAKEPPKAQEVAAVYTVLDATTTFFRVPLKGAEADFSLPGERAMILNRKAGEFYALEWNRQVYYVPEMQVKSLGTAVKAKAEEGYADESITLWDFPDPDRAQAVGAVKQGSICAMNYGMNGYVQVTFGGVTGFAEESAFTYPGGNGRDRYYLFLNKATRELTVYKANRKGERTDEAVLRVVVAIGKLTTPTPSGIFTLSSRERWHYFGPSYAPYAVTYTKDRYIHGPLYTAKRESAIVTSRLADFGKMATGGCVRTPYDEVQWIYFHCPSGTKLEIVNGVKAEETSPAAPEETPVPTAVPQPTAAPKPTATPRPSVQVVVHPQSP